MSYEKKDGDLVLFSNDRTNEKQPVLKGELFIGGETLEVALWGKTAKNGNKFWAGHAKPKRERQQADNHPDDSVPF